LFRLFRFEAKQKILHAKRKGNEAKLSEKEANFFSLRSETEWFVSLVSL
jgi:hypothetical protein